MKSGNAQLLETTTPTPATDSDRRRSPRRELGAKGWLSAEAGTGGRNFSITVGDLSLHGIGFACDTQLTPDSIHWLVLDAGGLRASSRLRVISCRKSDDDAHYDCGAEFF
jgi:hypothetical protein